MIDNEPTYNYVKGAGWVASMYEQVTRTAGKYNLTFIKKTPEPKDYYWIEYPEDDRTLEEIATNYVDTYSYQLEHGTITYYMTRWTKRLSVSMRTDRMYYTIKFEKIKPPKKPRAPRAPRARPRRAR